MTFFQTDSEPDESSESTHPVRALVDFAPGTIEHRALDVLHASHVAPVCTQCLLAWIAQLARAPGASLESVLERLSDLLYTGSGPGVSIAFEAIAWPGHAGRRARFEQLEAMLQRQALRRLPTAPGSSAH